STDQGIVEPDVAEESMVESIFPNPFRADLTIIFNPGMKGPLSCKVYSSTGQLVSIPGDKTDTQGSNTLSWDGRDVSGRNCPAGIYFIHIHSHEKTEIRKIIYAGP
ncbi:MAG: T9SS type A sorting domain-containing protein, partial [Bacteroidales bacterium]|nr:T9SS type A sorting domain-containing protein [Bacteroidales bacterium]